MTLSGKLIEDKSDKTINITARHIQNYGRNAFMITRLDYKLLSIMFLDQSSHFLPVALLSFDQPGPSPNATLHDQLLGWQIFPKIIFVWWFDVNDFHF